jgi:NAD(P)-dependent dehydrogenase (short-subunit alcohol dehydrogenase family)
MGARRLIDLSGRTALVTGGGRSVGRGIAEVLASAGAYVFVNDLHEDRAQDVVSAIEAEGGTGQASIFDVTDGVAVDAAFSAIESNDGCVDILVHNAGIAEGSGASLFSESGPEDWEPTIDLNLYGSMNLIRRSLPKMIEQRWGRIIQISSGASSRGLSIGVSAYGAAKAGAESLIRHVAVENGKHGVTANALALGLMANVGAGGSMSEGAQRLLRAVPVGRLGQPEEVGLAAAWLASEGSGFVTGQVIHLNGGSTFGH